MKFKEFVVWFDMNHARRNFAPRVAVSCMRLILDFYNIPFWKREREWRKIEEHIVEEVVIPINMDLRFREIKNGRKSVR